MFNALVVLGSGLVACGARGDKDDSRRTQADPTDSPGNDDDVATSMNGGETMTSEPDGDDTTPVDTLPIDTASPMSAPPVTVEQDMVIELEPPPQMLPEECPSEQWSCESVRCSRDRTATDEEYAFEPLGVSSDCSCDDTAAMGPADCDEGQVFACLSAVFRSDTLSGVVTFDCRCVQAAGPTCEAACKTHPTLATISRENHCAETDAGVLCGGCVVAGIGAR